VALRRKTVGIIVILVVVALAGLVVVQAVLLRSAFLSKEAAFQRNVMAAMGAVAQKMAATEMRGYALQIDSTDSIATGAAFVSCDFDTIIDDSIATKRFFMGSPDSCRPVVWIDGDSIRYRLPDAQRVQLMLIDAVSGGEHLVVDTFGSQGSYSYSYTVGGDIRSKDDYYWKFSSDSFTSVIKISDDLPGALRDQPIDEEKRMQMVVHVLAGLEGAELKPIEERINPQQMDSAIQVSLSEADIDLDYSWGIILGPLDSLRIAHPPDQAAALRKSDFRMPLFPYDVLSESARLVISFPSRTGYLWGQMAPLAIPTVVLMLIIVACFIYTIRTILSQRRFADHLMDFINNMTHEFKTPLSTVRLACEAIGRREVLDDSARVTHFNEMIMTEARRMQGQADKILQMAVLEQGNLDLDREEVDVHELLVGVVEAMALQVENRGGKIESQLSASSWHIMADRVHLTNAICNLLDNANKYSPQSPQIKVTTSSTGGELSITVSDRGVGMDSEERRQAFEKYYRVPKGDRHDVKGFGLGLTYVKLIVTSLGGTAQLSSRPSEGTQVEIRLPLTKSTELK